MANTVIVIQLTFDAPYLSEPCSIFTPQILHIPNIYENKAQNKLIQFL